MKLKIEISVNSMQKPMANVASSRGLRRLVNTASRRPVGGATDARRRAAGSIRCVASAPKTPMQPRTKKTSRQPRCSAMRPPSSLPTKPPKTVPATYTLITRGTISAGHSSVMYAMVMIKMPGVTSPCTNLQHASDTRLVAVEVSSAATASAAIEATMVGLRWSRSPKIASKTAEIATPTVDALIVMPTRPSDARKTCDSSGSNGCTQYRSRNANMPQKNTAKTCAAAPGTLSGAFRIAAEDSGDAAAVGISIGCWRSEERRSSARSRAA